jgi:hypothetical protein
MFYQLSLRLGRKRLVIIVMAASAFGILFVPSARGQTNWIIELDATGAGPAPRYKFAAPNPVPTTLPCRFETTDPPQSAETLRVCPGDSVLWKATTKAMKNQMYVHHDDPIFDKNGRTNQDFYASDGKTDGGVIKSDASLKGPHKYRLAVIDTATNRAYPDDPKIIIGTGFPEEQVNTIVKKAKALRDQLKCDPAAMKLADDIINDLEFLKKNLQSQR